MVYILKKTSEGSDSVVLPLVAVYSFIYLFCELTANTVTCQQGTQPFGTRPVSHVAIFSADLASVCKPCSRLGLNESFLVVAAMAC